MGDAPSFTAFVDWVITESFAKLFSTNKATIRGHIVVVMVEAEVVALVMENHDIAIIVSKPTTHGQHIHGNFMEANMGYTFSICLRREPAQLGSLRIIYCT